MPELVKTVFDPDFWGAGVGLTAGQGILEDLLEAEELEDRQVDGRVESQTSLVRAEGGVELDAVAAVDLELAVVILPDDAELDDALGDGDDLEGGAVLGVLLEEGGVLEGADQLCVIIKSALVRPVTRDLRFVIY